MVEPYGLKGRDILLLLFDNVCGFQLNCRNYISIISIITDRVSFVIYSELTKILILIIVITKINNTSGVRLKCF